MKTLSIIVLISFAGIIGILVIGQQHQKTLLKNAITRDEFRYRVMRKPDYEVVESVGKPDKTGTSGTTEYWYYYQKTRDPVTNTIDHSAQLVFQDGIVAAVNY